MYPSLALLTTSALLAFANPLPNPFTDLIERDHPCLPCQEHTSYSNVHEYDWKSPFQLIHSVSCQGVPGAPCQLSAGYEFSVGISVEVGLDLGLDFKEIFSAGVSTSISYEQSTGTTVGVTVQCPDNVQCGFMHQDAIHIVQGYKKVTRDCSNQVACGGGGVQDVSDDYYVVDFPKTGDNGFPITEILACACPDSDLSMKPDGMYVCPENCA